MSNNPNKENSPFYLAFKRANDFVDFDDNMSVEAMQSLVSRFLNVHEDELILITSDNYTKLKQLKELFVTEILKEELVNARVLCEGDVLVFIGDKA